MATQVYIFMRAILSPQHCLNDAYQRTFKRVLLAAVFPHMKISYGM